MNQPIELLFFCAPWCAPCRSMLSFVEGCAAAGGVVFTKVDIEAYPKLAAWFNVRSVPTIIACKSDEVLASHVGALSHQGLMDFIQGVTQ